MLQEECRFQMTCKQTTRHWNDDVVLYVGCLVLRPTFWGLFLHIYIWSNIPSLRSVDHCTEHPFLVEVLTLQRQCTACFWVLLKDLLGGPWGVFPGRFKPKYAHTNVKVQKIHKTYKAALDHTSTSKDQLSNVLDV